MEKEISRQRQRRRPTMGREDDEMPSKMTNCFSFPISALLLFTTATAVVLLLSPPAIASLQRPAQSAANNNNNNTTEVNSSRTRLQRQVEPPTGASNDQEDEYLSGHYEPLVLAATESNVDEPPARRQSQQQQQQQRGKQTLYACEEKQLQIECPVGQLVELIRAHYGRFSIQICNEHGQLDWRVNCTSPASYQIIADSCQAKQSCKLLASNEIFGDACPGTQKYLEVHYQCVQANQLLASTGSNGTGARPSANNFDSRQFAHQQQQQQQQQQPSAYPINQQQQQAARIPSNQVTAISGLKQQQADNVILNSARGFESQPAADFPAASESSQRPGAGRWQQPQQQQPGLLPPWMLDTLPQSAVATVPSARPGHCPELVARHLHWPATEPGLLVQLPCPAHSRPSDEQLGVASLACLPAGQWAPRVQVRGCQSAWLQAVLQRVAAGDSPLAILSELSLRTRVHAAQLAPSRGASQQQLQPSTLFGDDLQQIGKVVKRLVDDQMADLLNRIHDDKQRASFAREMLQLVVELTSNLADEFHLDAWLDLASQLGARQRLAGQLMQSLEQASVLLAGVLQDPAGGQPEPEATSFLRVTSNVYVAIKSAANFNKQPPTADLNATTRFQVSFPSKISTLGSRWQNAEQKFTLNLQAQLADEQANGNKQAGEQLKLVFVMLRGFSSHMEPASDANRFGATMQIVNSDLVSLSIVSEARRSIKVDLFAPVELVFSHLADQLAPDAGEHASSSTPTSGAGKLPSCVYWDTSSSEWQSDGCKLTDTNRTHSICACEHLTTFALLTDWDSVEQQQQQQQQQASSSVTPLASSPAANQDVGGHFIRQPTIATVATPQLPRVHLESVENELILAQPNGQVKSIYLAKLLENNFFGAHQSDLVIFIYVTCILAAVLLGAQIIATIYNQIHERSLLASIPPARPPPSLLVSNNHLGPFGTTTLANGQQHSLEGSKHTTSLINGNGHQLATYADASAAPNGKLQTLRQNYCATIESIDVNMLAKLPQDSMDSDYLPSHHHNPIEISHGRTQAHKLHWPVSLIFRLFALELLLLFLIIECQNYAHRPSPSSHQQQASFLPPIGSLTWLIVFLLLYLTSSFSFWLLSKLIQLNGVLLELKQHYYKYLLSNYSDGRNNNLKTMASSQYSLSLVPSMSMASQQHQMATISGNLTGGHQTAGTNMYNGSTYVHDHAEAYGAGRFARSSPSASKKSALVSLVDCLHLDSAARLLLNNRIIQSRQFHELFLAHVMPIVWSALMVFLMYSSDQLQTLNQLTFTLSQRSQVSMWPLVIDAIWSLPVVLLSTLLIPGLCLLMLLLALVSVLKRRETTTTASTKNGRMEDKLQQQQQPTIGSANVLIDTLEQQMPAVVTASQQRHQQPSAGDQPMADRPINSGALNGFAGSKHVSERHSFDANKTWKRLRLNCLVLFILLLLHSSAWISFLSHCHQTLRSPTQSGQVAPIWTFASSNLLLVLVLTFSQFGELKRASQLSGVTRLVRAYCCLCLCLCCCLSASSADSSSSSSGGCNHCGRRRRAHSNRLHAYSSGSSSAASSISSPCYRLAGAAGSNSATTQQQQQRHYAANQKLADSRSLFLRQQQQQQYGAYGVATPAAIHQQHLYQQLAASQQHIYDSASNLAPAVQHQDQQPLSAIHLIAQSHPQQPFAGLVSQPMEATSLHRSFGGSQIQLQSHPPIHLATAGDHFARTLQQSAHKQQQQQQQFHQHSMSSSGAALAPMSMTNRHQHQQQQLATPLLNGTATLSRHQLNYGQQQQQQNQGEADGPLVALSNGSSSSSASSSGGDQPTQQPAPSSRRAPPPPVTFGPNCNNPNNNNNNKQATGPQLFSGQANDRNQRQVAASGAELVPGAIQQQQQPRRSSAFPVCDSQQQQPQFYSMMMTNQQLIDGRESAGRQIEDAEGQLRHAPAPNHQYQFQRSANVNHGRARRANSKLAPPASAAANEFEHEIRNIYDVANYALS